MVMLLASLVLMQGATAPVVCPVMGSPVVKGAEATDYAGVRFSYCCGGCREQFEKEPAKFIDAANDGGKVVGVSLFDPVSHRRVESAKAKGGSSDFQGIRYYFETADDKKAFDKDPKAMAARPKQEALYCLVMKRAVSEYAKSSAYVDHEGVRYYFCCPGCDTKFAADPAAYAKNGEGRATAPKAITRKQEANQATSFSCKHCGRTMRVKTDADLQRTCTACACSKTAGECKPGG
jgi:YHS domain-containing protein